MNYSFCSGSKRLSPPRLIQAEPHIIWSTISEFVATS